MNFLIKILDLKSRIFYLDQNEDIIFLSELKKIDYLYQKFFLFI